MKDGWYIDVDDTEYVRIEDGDIWQLGYGENPIPCDSDGLNLRPAVINYWRYPDRDGWPTEGEDEITYLVQYWYDAGFGLYKKMALSDWSGDGFYICDSNRVIRYMPAPPLEEGE